MRPILKPSQSAAAASMDRPIPSAAGGSGKSPVRSLFTPPSGSGRRVTFSPFTISRRKRFMSAGGEARGKMSSGFTFSSAVRTKRRHDADAKRQRELELMRALYQASHRRPHSLQERLLRKFPALRQYYDTAKCWLDYLRATRDMVMARLAEERRTPRRLKRPREPWTAFDVADRAYVRQLALPAAELAHSPSAVVMTAPPRTPTDPHVPRLAPAHHGCFSSFLRRAGVAVEEDEARASAAVDDDLRGVRAAAPLHLRSL